MPPDTHPPPPLHIEDDEAERLAMEAAVAEARASDPADDVPHEVVREELLRFAEAMRRRIAAPAEARAPG